jgi:hypothetical protein
MKYIDKSKQINGIILGNSSQTRNSSDLHNFFLLKFFFNANTTYYEKVGILMTLKLLSIIYNLIFPVSFITTLISSLCY